MRSINHFNRWEKNATKSSSNRRRIIKFLASLTLGKYCTGTDGVVERRNLSRFPASSTVGAGGGDATAASAAAAALAAGAAAHTDGLEGASARLSASTLGSGAAGSAAPAGAGADGCGGLFLPAAAAARGVSVPAAGEEGR